MIKKLIHKLFGGKTEKPAAAAAGRVPAETTPGRPPAQQHRDRPVAVGRPERERQPKARSGGHAQAARPPGAAAAKGHGAHHHQAGPERKPREQDNRGRRERPGGERERRRGEPPRPAVLPALPPMPPWDPPKDPTLFANYDLPEPVRRGIVDAGFTECTPIQAKALTPSLQGKDIAGQSQTGTGKTAAFLITIFTRLLRRGPTGRPGPRALIIAPTRELTVQIEHDARLMGRHTGLVMVAVYGGVDYDKQRRALAAGVDLLVGTPGRLIDYLKQGIWRPDGVEILVIDEADRMFDLGFIADLRYILRRLPPYTVRQSMLFSATLSLRVMELTYEYMNLPTQISSSSERLTVDKAEEVLYHVSQDEKPALLLGLLKTESWSRMMVFTNMKVEAEKVARLMIHHGYHARAITGNLEQEKRLRLMEDFKSGKLPILVATDVASRGLHIEGVTHVVNWDLPQDPEDYVHRIGRTARAGASGKAISLADEDHVFSLEEIEQLIGYKVPVIWHDAGHLAEVKRGWEARPPEERRDRWHGQSHGGRDQRRGQGPGGGGRGGGHGNRGRHLGGRPGRRSS